MAITPEQARRELARRELKRRGITATPSTPAPAPSPVQRTESLIASRPSAIRSAVQNPLDIIRRNFGQPREVSMLNAALPIAAEGVEGVLGSLGLGLQQGMPASQIRQDVTASMRGERPAKISDIARASGVPALMAETSSNQFNPFSVPNILGLVSTLGLGGPKAARTLGTKAEIAAEGVAAKAGAAKQAAGRAVAGIPEQLQIGRQPTLTKPNPARSARLDHIRARILRAPKLAGEEFEGRLNELEQVSPDQGVNLSEPIQVLKNAMARNPSFQSLWNRAVKNSKVSAQVQQLVESPELAIKLTMKQAQSVKRVLSQVLKSKFQQVSPELFDAHLDAMDAWHGIRKAQVEAFPEFDDIAQGYHKVLSNFRSVKGKLKEGQLEPSILTNFGNNTEILDALRQIITPDTVKMIEGLRQATRLRTGVGRALKLGGAATVASMTPPGRAILRVLGIGQP